MEYYKMILKALAKEWLMYNESERKSKIGDYSSSTWILDDQGQILRYYDIIYNKYGKVYIPADDEVERHIKSVSQESIGSCTRI